MNRDFFKIHLSITLARINILTSSFFLAITLSKALHLTPKLLKSKRIFFSPYKGGPIFKNPFPEAVFWYKTFFFIFSGIFHIKYLIAPYRPTKFQNHWSLLMKEHITFLVVFLPLTVFTHKNFGKCQSGEIQNAYLNLEAQYFNYLHRTRSCSNQFSL